MSRVTSTADRQRAVWRISAALAGSRLDQHDRTVVAALERTGGVVGVQAVALWETDLSAGITRQTHVWTAAGVPASARDDVERPVADDVVEQMFANDGIAILPITTLANERQVADGWENGSGIAALVDLDGQVARTLTVITPEPAFDDEQIGLTQVIATILRQYFVRIRIERDLEQRFDLAAFTSHAVGRLGTATEETMAEVVSSILDQLVDRIGVRSAMVYRVGDTRSTRVHRAGSIEDPRWDSLPRSGHARVRRSGEPDTSSACELATRYFGPDQDLIDPSDATRVTLIATEVDDGRVRMTLCLMHEPREWNQAELQALTLIAAAITQNRARAEAMQESIYREAVQGEFAAVAAEFLRAAPATVEQIVDDAIERVCQRLGASLGVIFSLDGDESGNSRIVSMWSAGAAPYAPGDCVPPPQPDVPDLLRRGQPLERVIPLTPGLLPEIRALVEAEGEDVWTMLASPLTGGPNPAAFALALAGDHSARFGTLRELTTVFADLLSQLRARIRLELAADRDAAVQTLLRRASATLTQRSADDFDGGVRDVFDDAARFLDLHGLSSWQVDEDEASYAVRHAVGEGRSEGAIVEFGAEPAVDEARYSGEACRRRTTVNAVELDCMAVARGEGVRRAILVAHGVPGRLEPAACRLLEELNNIVARFEERIAVERYSQSAFGAAPIGIVLCDDDGVIVQCNASFADFVALDSPFDLVGRTLRDVVPIEVATGADEPSEFTFQRWDTIRIWGTARSTPIESATTGERLWLVHVEDISDRRRADQLLRHQATHDELTGLANRRVLAERTGEALEQHRRPAVLLLDLDRFKTVNDSLGHDRGDELLIAIADRLRLAVRPDDLVVRLGGDEFAVLVSGPVDAVDARCLAERLQQTLVAPIRLAGQDVFPSASIGIALADTPTTVADMLRRADTAMYRAKAEGRGRHATFDGEMRDQVTERLSIEAGLRRALDGGELCVHYQPEVAISDGRIIGAEALVRWDHPERGLLPAAAFIDIAEETGVVVEIGELVLRAACIEATSWPDPSSILRVNFAAAQLQRPQTIELVRDSLAASGLAPDRLCVEITESAMMEDVRQAEEVLHRLKRLGVRIAVDDFGTGFSSLAYLKRFPVDTLKIDRTFVDGLDGVNSDDTFVRSIISLADALGLDVVAEGVESQAHADALERLGCRRAQGYFYGRPMPATELRALLAATI